MCIKCDDNKIYLTNCCSKQMNFVNMNLIFHTNNIMKLQIQPNYLITMYVPTIPTTKKKIY